VVIALALVALAAVGVAALFGRSIRIWFDGAPAKATPPEIDISPSPTL
jgi:hypothetical protein